MPEVGGKKYKYTKEGIAHRLAQRWGLTNGKNVIQTENDLKRIFPKKTWSKLHLQIIFYGRMARNG